MNPDSSPGHRRQAWLLWATALGCFLPLICWQREFRDLFWFGDEWDQLDQISRQGFWHWTLGYFGENFAPVMKLTWGTLALASHGSYFIVVVSVWCLHALCTFLFGRWLQLAGFGPIAIAIAAMTFGLAFTNVETLGWTIQLITVQGITFFVAAALWRQARENDGKWTAAAMVIFGVLLLLSTFSFVRGPLAGLSLTLVTLVPTANDQVRNPSRLRRAMVVLICLLPAIVSFGIIASFAPGNQHNLAAAGWRAPGLFAASYFFLNPAHKFAGEASWTTAVLVGYGAAKIAVLAIGWWQATPRQRRLLLPLLVFDLGNALLMGIGRYNEPLITATSSRYQYISLLCTLPFVGIVLERLIGMLALFPVWRRTAIAAVVIALAFICLYGWPHNMADWSAFRGRNTREVLFHDPHPPLTGAIPGISFLSTQRAKELTAEYHLH